MENGENTVMTVRQAADIGVPSSIIIPLANIL